MTAAVTRALRVWVAFFVAVVVATPLSSSLQFTATQSIDDLVEDASAPQPLSAVSVAHNGDYNGDAHVRLLITANHGLVSTSALKLTSALTFITCNDTSNVLLFEDVPLEEAERVLQSLLFRPARNFETDPRCGRRPFRPPLVKVWMVDTASKDPSSLVAPSQLLDGGDGISPQSLCAGMASQEDWPATQTQTHVKRIAVSAVNDAPQITIPVTTSGMDVNTEQCVSLPQGITLEDVDIHSVYDDNPSAAANDDTQQARHSLTLSVTKGLLQLDHTDALALGIRVVGVVDYDPRATTLREASFQLNGQLVDLQALLPSIGYCAPSVLVDTTTDIKLALADNGVCGGDDDGGESMSATAMLAVSVRIAKRLGTLTALTPSLVIQHHANLSLSVPLLFTPGNIDQVTAHLSLSRLPNEPFDRGMFIGLEDPDGLVNVQDQGQRANEVTVGQAGQGSLSFSGVPTSASHVAHGEVESVFGMAVVFTKAATVGFHFTYQQCSRVGECSSIRSVDLDRTSTENKLLDVVRDLVVASGDDGKLEAFTPTVYSHQNGTWLEWQVFGLRASFIAGLQLSVNEGSGVALRKLVSSSRQGHAVQVRGEATRVAKVLRSLTVYAMRWDTWQYTTLECAVTPSQTADHPGCLMSVSVDVAVAPNGHTIRLHAPSIVRGNHSVATGSLLPNALGLVDVRFPNGTTTSASVPSPRAMPLLALSFSSESFAFRYSESPMLAAASVQTTTPLVHSTTNTYLVTGSVRELQSALANIIIETSNGFHTSTVSLERQRFELRVRADQDSPTIVSQAISTSKPATGTLGLTGAYVLRAALVDGYYSALDATVRGIVCESAAIQPSATGSTVETAILSMPCVATTGGVSPERTEVQMLELQSIVPSVPIRDLSVATFVLKYATQPSVTVAVGATVATLEAKLRTLTGDAALTVSEQTNSDDAQTRAWTVTFSTVGSKAVLSMSLTDASTPLRLQSRVQRKGIQTSDLTLAFFFPWLAVSVRQSKSSLNVNEIALELQMWSTVGSSGSSSSDDEQMQVAPRLTLGQSTIQDASTGEIIPVRVDMISADSTSSGHEQRFRLEIQGRQTKWLVRDTVTSDQFRSAIDALQMPGLDLVDVTQEPLSDTATDGWIMEVSYLQPLAIHVDVMDSSSTSRHGSVVSVDSGTLSFVVDDSVDIALVLSGDSQQILDRITMRLRLASPVRTPQLVVASRPRRIHVGETLVLDGITVEGDDIPVTLQVQCDVGNVAVTSATGDSSSSLPLDNQVPLSALKKSLATSRLLFQVHENHVNAPLPMTIQVTLSLSYGDGKFNSTTVIAVDILPSELLPRVYLDVPMDTLRVTQELGAPLIGVALRMPPSPLVSEPALYKSLDLSHHRLRVFIASTTGGSFTMESSIQQFLGARVVVHTGSMANRSSEIKIEGSIDHINLALGALTYTASTRGAGHVDEIIFQVQSDGEEDASSGQQHEFRLPVSVTRAKMPVQVRWLGKELNTSFVVRVDEDHVIALSSVSLYVEQHGGSDGGSGSGDDFSEAPMDRLNVTLAASHGQLVLTETAMESKGDLIASAVDHSVLQFSGNVSFINALLQHIEYRPHRNYNGPDTIVVSVTPYDTTMTMTTLAPRPQSDLIRVFLRPMDDLVLLQWAASHANISRLTLTSCCGVGTAVVLPLLVITDVDDEDDEDDDDNGDPREGGGAHTLFFKSHHTLRLEVETPTESGLLLRHDAVETQEDKAGSMRLTFEGRARDLRKLLASVYVASSRRAFATNDHAVGTITLKVTKLDSITGSAVMTPVEAQLFVTVDIPGDDDAGHSQQLPLPMTTEFVEMKEDDQLALGSVFAWDEMDEWWPLRGDGARDESAGNVVAIRIAASHGELFSDATPALSSPQRNLSFPSESAAHVRRVLSRLVYASDPNYAGDDAIQLTVGRQNTTLWVRVLPVNDEPTLLLLEDSANITHEAIRQFVAPFHVHDPDEGDFLTVEITVDAAKATLLVPDLSVFQQPGSWVEGWTPEGGKTWSTHRLLVHGPLAAINEAFAKPMVVEVIPPPHEENAAVVTLHVCVSDVAGATQCNQQVLAFTASHSLLFSASEKQQISLPFNERRNLADLLSTKGPLLLASETMVQLRLLPLIGYFEVSPSSRDDGSVVCGKSREKAVGELVQTELRGPWRCLPLLFNRTTYAVSSSRRSNATTTDEIKVELWIDGQMRTRQVIEIKLLLPTPRFQFIVADSSSSAMDDEAVAAATTDRFVPPVWRWTLGKRAMLQSFVKINITITEIHDHQDDHDDTNRVLSLNVTCSSSCLLSYDLTQGPIVPRVVYVDVDGETQSPLQSSRFLGTRASLEELLQTLQISDHGYHSTTTEGGDGAVVLRLAEVDPSSPSSLYENVVTATIPFRFVLTSAPLQWQVGQSEYRATDPSNVVRIDRVALQTDGGTPWARDPARRVRVSITCGEDLPSLSSPSSSGVLVTINHSGVGVLERPCGPETEPIDLVSTLEQVNNVLGKLQVKPSSVPTNHLITSGDSTILRFALVGEDVNAAESNHVDVRVHFGTTLLSPLKSLEKQVFRVDRAIHVDEDAAIALGELFTVDDGSNRADEWELYRLTAAVRHGSLELPSRGVCCVHLFTTPTATRLTMEGTLRSLHTALAMVQYKPQPDFWGVDALQISLDGFSSRSDTKDNAKASLTSAISLWTHDVEINARPVNDVPRITVRRLTSNSMDLDGDGDAQLNHSHHHHLEVAVEITDVDLVQLPRLREWSGDQETPRTTTGVQMESSATMRVQLVATDTKNTFFSIPNWPNENDHVAVVNATYREINASSSDALGTPGRGFIGTSLTFDAPLSTIHAVLSHVTVVVASCEAGQADEVSLTITVSDLGHGVRGWDERVATETVDVCGHDPKVPGSPLTLSLPPDHAYVDERQRTLTITGLSLASNSDSSQSDGEDDDDGDSVRGQSDGEDDDDGDSVRVTGTAAFCVVPEVQRVRLVGPQQMQVLTVTLTSTARVSSVTGTFELTNNVHFTTVFAQASAMQVDELMGDEGTGRGTSESMEAHLRLIYGDATMAAYRIHVASEAASDGHTVAWRIYASIAAGAMELPALHVGDTALVVPGGGVATVATQSKTHASALAGSFSLQMGSESTQLVRADASALEVQTALEELPSIDVVQVAMAGPYTFDVTFFLPSANLPLLMSDASELTPVSTRSNAAWPTETASGATVEITRITQGQGQGTVYQVDVGAIYRSPVYHVRATTSSATTLGGQWFSLGFHLDTTLVATTEQIALDAVAMKTDEGVGQQQGGRVGNSMQSLLERAIDQLLELGFAGSATTDGISPIQVLVTRSSSGSPPTEYHWTITFVNAPAGFPLLLSVAAPANQPLAMAVQVTITTVTPSNAVNGFFTLGFGVYETVALPVTATARDVHVALHGLPSIHSTEDAFGAVVVRRNELPQVGGASFALLFTEETSFAHMTSVLTANGGQLTGLGAYVSVTALSSREKTSLLVQRGERASSGGSGGQWILPAFASSRVMSSSLPGSSWTNGVWGEYTASHFELRGSVQRLGPLLTQLTYVLPVDWCGGLVGLIVHAERVAGREEAAKTAGTTAVAKTMEQRVQWETPRDLAVVFDDQHDAASGDVVVERGAVLSVGFVRVNAPVSSHKLLWIRVRLQVDDGQLSLPSRATTNATSGSSSIVNDSSSSNVLWINGTVASVNTQLLGLEYSTALSTSDTIDVLAVELFVDVQEGVATQPRVIKSELLIRITAPPLVPRVQIIGDSDERKDTETAREVMVTARDDQPLALAGFISIVDANGKANANGQFSTIVTLTIHAAVGRVFFSRLDGQVALVDDGDRSSGGLTLRGDLKSLNDALHGLQYEPSLVFDHTRDSVTVAVACHPPNRPLLRDSRVVTIEIHHAIHVPHVAIGNSSAIAYAAKEDNGYQFPNLTLVIDRLGASAPAQPQRRQRQRRPMVELRRTDLLPLAVTAAPSTDNTTDWRHRWVADMPGLGDLDRAPSSFASSPGGSVFFFTGSDLIHSEELWVSDGSSSGTKLFVDVMPGNGSSRPSDVVALPLSSGTSTQLVFAADGIDTSWMLQTEKTCNYQRMSSTVSTTSPTVQLQYVVAASSTWNPSAEYDCPQRGWRWATTAQALRVFGGDGSGGQRKSEDPTEPYVFYDACDWSGYMFGGVTRKHFRFADSRVTGALKHAGRRDSAQVETSFSTSDFAGIVCIRDDDERHQEDYGASGTGRELWTTSTSTSAAAARATRLSDIEPGPRGSDPRFLTPFQSKWVLFQATTTQLGSELYKTDGTSSGTVLVEDIWRGPRSSNPSDFAEWLSVTGGDGRLYFAATSESGREIWSTDATSSGVSTERTRRAASMVGSNGLLVGTALVLDICTGASSSEPRFLTPLGSQGVFFSATDCTTHGRELWFTDGTPTGTKMVADLNPSPGQGSDPSHLVAFHGKLYFAATASVDAMGRELFVSDGTTAGTKLLVELVPGAPSAAPSLITVANNQLHFHAVDASGRGNLWTSDGTAAGTTKVWDPVFAQSYRVRGDKLFVLNNAVYYLVEKESREGSDGQDQDQSSTDDDIFELTISVNRGAVSIPPALLSPSPSLSTSPSVVVTGTHSHLQEALRHVLFHPPLNWNVLQTPGDHVVQWTFTVASTAATTATTSATTTTTTADLLVRPQIDPPVIVVPTDVLVQDESHSQLDFLSHLRLECRPIIVLEDVATSLTGFSVRAVDDSDSNRLVLWELEMTVDRGRVDLVDSGHGGCVKTVVRGQLSATKQVHVRAPQVSCLARLLGNLVYTGDPDASGADALHIRVGSVSLLSSVVLAQDTAIVPILVTEMNDAPYLTSTRSSGFVYESEEDRALVLTDLRVVDPDASSSSSGNDVITVDLRVRHGSVALVAASVSGSVSGVTVIVNETRSGLPPLAASSRLVLSGSLYDVNAALSRVGYTSATDWNSLMHVDDNDGYDIITIELSDSQVANQSSHAELFMYVAPTPDPVVISRPVVRATSVYAANGDEDDDGVLHGDEDAWLDMEHLGFTSVDDTSRLALDVTLRVSHGQLRFYDTKQIGVTTSGSLEDGSMWRLRGRFAYVNHTVATVRYLPARDFYGQDALEIVATASDSYVSESLPLETTLVVAIEIHAMNDPPVWTLPFSTVAWTQDAPTRIAGVALDDVDVHSVDCAVLNCDLEVVVETTASGSLTFPRLVDLPQFTTTTVSSSSSSSSYIVLSGSLSDLNRILSELVLTTQDADSLVHEPVEIWFTADDRGTFGSGGPQVARRRMVVMPLQWTSHSLELVIAPNDHVLSMDEDTRLVFDLSNQQSIQFVGRDASTRATASAPQYQVEIETQHGRFHLPTSTEGLLLLPSTTTRLVRFCGFLPQINAAFRGSAYAPDTNWFGSEEIRITAREKSHNDETETTPLSLSPTLEPATSGSIFVFVSPVCDAPHWQTSSTVARDDATQRTQQADVTLDEDSQVLVSLKRLEVVDPDATSETDQRDLVVTIDVLDDGGVMLATTRGLQIHHEQSPQWTATAAATASSLRLLFFSHVELRGRSADLNAALRGLIYRPRPDFHTNGHVKDAIVLKVTSPLSTCPQSSSATDGDDIGVGIVRVQIHAVNDAPQVVSLSLFTRVSRAEIQVERLHLMINATTLEAYEDTPLVLEGISLYDADMTKTSTTNDNAADGSSLPTDMRLRVSCRSCSVQSSHSVDFLQRIHGILVVASDDYDTHSLSDAWQTTTTYYAPISVLNDVLLPSLVLTSTPQFHGHAVVLLEVSDLGYNGRGGPLEAAFAMVVRVHSVADAPQILVPPYGTRDLPLQVDEHGSVLLRGAPPTDQRSTTTVASTSRPRTTHQLFMVDPQASKSATRIHSLLDVVSLDDTSAMSFYAIVNGQQLVFSAFHPASGHELWTTDGTVGTRMLKDLAPGVASSRPQYLTRFSVDGYVYFAASGLNVDAWRQRGDHRDACDGFRESAFAPGVHYAVASQATWDVDESYDCPVGFEWMTTAEAARVFLGTMALDGHASEPLVYYDQCGWHGYDWGGVARTHFRFADSKTTGAFKHAGHRDSYRVDVGMETLAFAGIVCRVQDQATDDPHGNELWRTDGTTEGTQRVVRIGPPAASDATVARPSYLTEFQGHIYFQATTAQYGAELWMSDGTREGTTLVADVAFGTRSSAPQQLVVANGRLFFTASTATYGRELWVSDGAPRSDFAHVDHGSEVATVGTKLVLDIHSGLESSTPLFLTELPFSGLLLFQANDGVHGAELWRSDGTAAGTTLMLDIHTGPQSSTPQYLTLYGGQVFFQADDGVHGAELWTTDGSAANTKLLVDVAKGAGGSRPRFLSVLPLGSGGGPSLVFAASSDRDPQVVEMWTSDGTSSGTQQLFRGSREVARINDKAMASLHKPQFLALQKGFVFFGEMARSALSSIGNSQYSSAHVGKTTTRSVTLADADDNDANDGAVRQYSVTLQCGYGQLSLTPQSCAVDPINSSNNSHNSSLTLRGSLASLNCALTEIVYHATAKPTDTSDRHRGWSDAIVVTLTEENGDAESDGRAFQATETIPVWVVAFNHAPVLDGPSRVYAARDQWQWPLPDLLVSDQDAGADALLFVRISAASGRLRMRDEDHINQDDPVAMLSVPNDPQGAPSLEFAASISQINRLLTRHLEYACLSVDDCVDGTEDTLWITVDDNGFTGTGGPQSTTQTTTVVIVAT